MIQESALLTLLYNQTSNNPTSSFEVSDALFDGIKLSNGSTVLSAFNNATGGIIVDLGIGQGTATIKENIYDSYTIDYSDPSINSLIGHPSLFGETFTQNGEMVATIEPYFMGDGINVVMSDGVTYSGMSDIFSNITFNSNSLTNISSLQAPSYLNDFSFVSSVANTTSSLDVYDAATAVDGLDILDLI